jgi:2-polyprenyl-3-methyl-5-hydroxy-6-metoxy-1,4-benzoquinol methylase
MTKTICPICSQELDTPLRPDFLLCPDCQVAVRLSSTIPAETDRLNVYSDDWAEKHSNNPIAHDVARSTAGIVSSVLPNGSTVLDIGCGSGMLVDRLSRTGYQAYGLDWSEPAILFAREHYQGEYLLSNVEQGLAIGRTFDCAVASHILEHLEKPHEFLQSVKEILEPEGYLVVVVPNLDWWNPKSIYRFNDQPIFDVEHIVGYSVKGLRKVLEANGYEVVKMVSRTHRLAILTAVWITAYHKLFGDKGSSSMKSGYVKVTGEWMLAKVLAQGMKPVNWWSEMGLRGMELIAIARKQ